MLSTAELTRNLSVYKRLMILSPELAKLVIRSVNVIRLTVIPPTLLRKHTLSTRLSFKLEINKPIFGILSGKKPFLEEQELVDNHNE